MFLTVNYSTITTRRRKHASFEIKTNQFLHLSYTDNFNQENVFKQIIWYQFIFK